MEYSREWRRGVVCGLIAGGVAGWIWTTIGGWVIAANAENWWQIASAIGTLGAVVSSVWMSSRIARRESTEKKRMVRMAWARINPELVAVRRNSEHAALALYRMGRSRDGRPIRPIDISILEASLSALSVEQCEAALSALVSDESERGVLVSELVGDFHRIRRRGAELLKNVANPAHGFEIHAFTVFEEIAAFGEAASQLLDLPDTRAFSKAFRNEFAQSIGMHPLQ